MGDRFVLQLICRKVCWNSLSVYRSRNWMSGTCLSVYQVYCRRVFLQVPMAGNCNLATQMQNTIWCGKCGEYHGNSLVSLSVHKLDDWDLPVCLPNLDWLGIQLSWLHTHQVTVSHNTWVDIGMSHKQKCVQSTEVRQQEEGWRIVITTSPPLLSELIK